MNAPQRKMMKDRRARAAARVALCLGAGASLSACVPGNPFATAPVDPSSPVAAEVARAAAINKTYPTFAQIPPAPTDVRSEKAWAAAVGEVESAHADLVRKTAPETWSLQSTEAFAAKAQAAVKEEGPVAREDDTEAFTRRAQERATPPPPPR